MKYFILLTIFSTGIYESPCQHLHTASIGENFGGSGTKNAKPTITKPANTYKVTVPSAASNGYGVISNAQWPTDNRYADAMNKVVNLLNTDYVNIENQIKLAETNNDANQLVELYTQEINLLTNVLNIWPDDNLQSTYTQSETFSTQSQRQVIADKIQSRSIQLQELKRTGYQPSRSLNEQRSNFADKNFNNSNSNLNRLNDVRSILSGVKTGSLDDLSTDETKTFSKENNMDESNVYVDQATEQEINLLRNQVVEGSGLSNTFISGYKALNALNSLTEDIGYQDGEFTPNEIQNFYSATIQNPVSAQIASYSGGVFARESHAAIGVLNKISEGTLTEEDLNKTFNYLTPSHVLASDNSQSKPFNFHLSSNEALGIIAGGAVIMGAFPGMVVGGVIAAAWYGLRNPN